MDDCGLYNRADHKWRYDYDCNATTLNAHNAESGPFGDNDDLPIAGNFDTN